MSKKHAKRQFPHFGRVKPARLLQPLGFLLRWSLLGLMLGLNVYFWGPWNAQSPAILGAEAHVSQKTAERDLAFWQDVASSYPTYKDAHRMVAALAFELSLDAVARDAALRVLALDPNDEVAREILTILSSLQAP